MISLSPSLTGLARTTNFHPHRRGVLRAYPPKDPFARPAPASSIFQRSRRFPGYLIAFWPELVPRRRAEKVQTRWTGFLGASPRDRAKPDDNTRYLAQWQAEVWVVMEKSGRRHTRITSITRILHYCEAAGLFDSNKPLCPVASAPVSTIPITREPSTLAADRKSESAPGLG